MTKRNVCPGCKMHQHLLPAGAIAIGMMLLSACASHELEPTAAQGPGALPGRDRLWIDSESDQASLPGNVDDEARGSDKQPNATVVDLLDVLAAAQEYDATFLVAREQFDVTRAGVPIARSGLLPQLSASADIGRYVDSIYYEGVDYTQSELDLTLAQTLFDRSTALALRKAKLDASTAQLRLIAAHEDLVLRVAIAYFDVLRAESELEFRVSDLEAIQRQLLQAEERFEVGMSASTDKAEALAQRDLARSSEISARNTVADTREALAEISGIAGESVNLTNLSGALPLERPDPADIQAWEALAEEFSSTLAAARGDADSAARQIAVVRAGRLPTLSISGTVSEIDNDNDLLGEGQSDTLLLSADWAIYAGGSISAQVAQQKAQARLAAESSTGTHRSVTRATRNAYRGVLAAISQVQALEQALVSTREAASATEAGFRAGSRTAVEGLESQRDVFRARTDYDSARYDYIVNWLQLQSTAGTLTDDDLRLLNNWLNEGS